MSVPDENEPPEVNEAKKAPSPQELSKIAFEFLSDFLKKVGVNVSDIREPIEELARDFAKYVLSPKKEDQENLEHIKSQAQLIGAVFMKSTQNQTRDLFATVLENLAIFTGTLIKNVFL